MLTDDDLAGLQEDFGSLAAKVACKIRRGTSRGTSGVVGAPYVSKANHTCSVLTPAQMKDPYVTSWVQNAGQGVKNPRVLLLPLPIPNNVEIARGDIVTVGTGAQATDYKVMDLDDDISYNFQRILFCQYAEGLQV